MAVRFRPPRQPQTHKDMIILKNKTFNEMAETIDRQHNRIIEMAKTHVEELEDQKGKYNTLQNTYDSVVKGAAKQIEDLNNKLEDYKNKLHEAKNLDEKKNNRITAMENTLKEADDEMRKQHHEITKLKEQLDGRTEEVKELEEKVKKNASQIVATTTLYEAGVMEMAKFMRTTPAYKGKKKADVQQIADEIICKKAKKLIEERTTVKQKENKENKEEQPEKTDD